MKPSRTAWGVVSLLAAACATDESGAGGGGPSGFAGPGWAEVGTVPAGLPTPVVTDSCDEPTFAGVSWLTASSAHFVAHYLPGTVAERDLDALLARREQAYAAIRETLGITAMPKISVHLSPSRLAAWTLGRAYGQAWPGQDRYEVIYTGASNSYEVVRPGHELTHLLEYHLYPAQPRRIPLLTEGLAEFLDQSGRDLHEDYARQLLAGIETRVRVASFDGADVSGRNYGRAGSLVKSLVDRYGVATFLSIFATTKVTWLQGCWTSVAYGCIGTPEAIVRLLDGAIRSATGETWGDVQLAWEAQVKDAIDSADLTVSPVDRAEIENLIDLMDMAIIRNDTAMYRSTLEGFYCERGAGDPYRDAIASRVTSTFTTSTSRVLRILPTGIKNFTSARLTVERSEDRGAGPPMALSVERFPTGWRVTYGPDWW